MSAPMPHSEHKLVQLPNGTWSLHCVDVAETYHPVVGPEIEGHILYAKQIHLERINSSPGPFVIWDVGLGAAANALAVIQEASLFTGKIAIYSFEHNLKPLQFALKHTEQLSYLSSFKDIVQQLLDTHKVSFQYERISVSWEIIYGDFPLWLHSASSQMDKMLSPAAILYDAYSPKKNPDMYTLALFKELKSVLSDNAPCLLVSYSRATLLRSTLLLAGFYVGKGAATGEKEETTLASNTLSLIRTPLDHTWLARAQKSTSAEPIIQSVYHQRPLSEESRHQLSIHPQFRL